MEGVPNPFEAMLPGLGDGLPNTVELCDASKDGAEPKPVKLSFLIAAKGELDAVIPVSDSFPF